MTIPPRLEVKTLREFEKQYLTNLLELTEGNVTRAAELAGNTGLIFYNLLKKYGISHGKFRK